MLRISVLLPAPFGPSSPRHSALRNSSVNPSTAVSLPKRLTRASTRNGGDEVETGISVSDNGISFKGVSPYYMDTTSIRLWFDVFSQPQLSGMNFSLPFFVHSTSLQATLNAEAGF